MPPLHGVRRVLRGLSTPMKWALTALRRPPATGSMGKACGTAIDQVVTDLENLNGSTERDFLAIGEKLMEFSSTARQIASDMAALGELISGEHGRNVSSALTRILEHAREMDAGIEQSGCALEEVHGLSAPIRTAFAGIGNTVSTFRTLCTLTRIETSRLGDTGGDFGDLAAEVRPLSESIQTSGEGVLKASLQLDQGVQAAIRSASELRLRQLKELPALIAGVIDGLNAFDERRRRAAELSCPPGRRLPGIVRDGRECGPVGPIPRYYAPADRARNGSAPAPSLHLCRTVDSLPPDARAVLALQSSQLCGAARVFAASAGRLECDLESIAARVQGMAEAGKSLMGISDDQRDSFFLRMEGHFTAILKMFGSCATGQAEMESTAARLAETIGRMRASVAEVRGIEIRIQRIATNATIRATHIGDQRRRPECDCRGHAPPGPRFQREHRNRSRRPRCNGRCRRARVRAPALDAPPDAHAGAHEVMDEIRRSVVELHSSNESSFSRVHQISTLGSRLAGDFGAVRRGFSAGTLFARVVAAAQVELDRLAAQLVSASPEGAETAPPRAPGESCRALHDAAGTRRPRFRHPRIGDGGGAERGAGTGAPRRRPRRQRRTVLIHGDDRPAVRAAQRRLRRDGPSNGGATLARSPAARRRGADRAARRDGRAANEPESTGSCDSGR